MRHFARIIRTGAALQIVHVLMAAAFLVLAIDTGHAREVAGPRSDSASRPTPGAIGVTRRLQPGPCPESMLPDAVQPVEIRGPKGMQISIETAEGWSPVHVGPLRMGLVVGHPYRLRITNIPQQDGRELFPSVRVLAKLATPPGMAWRFPVEIVIDGIDETTVAEAMAAGIAAAAGPELLAVSAGNYGGKLGKFHFHLHRVLAPRHPG